MIKTNKPIKYVPGEVGPVCMPTKRDDGLKRDSDGELRVYVAGWGRTTNAKCYTSNDGPKPSSQCKFPFKSGGVTQSQCSTDSTPSSQNPVCKEFFNWATKSKEKLGESFHDAFFIIYYDKNKKEAKGVSCYHQVWTIPSILSRVLNRLFKLQTEIIFRNLANMDGVQLVKKMQLLEHLVIVLMNPNLMILPKMGSQRLTRIGVGALRIA